ncbi:MAG: prevent-host-death protein [Longimicrobiaceae bacterium]
MHFVSTKEFCERPDLVSEGDVVLTTDGVPIAVVLSLRGEEDPVELERLIRRARAEAAWERLRRQARTERSESLTMEEIDAEIAAARAERRASLPRND